ncbi:hypothetical protein HMPREF9441_01299 [Paraprevotella clara YIT 11840]|uniref:Uncharacterized protein n=1 Tax=Paraprevotella clara YIT 11840 TaxID=762968 RepID=G5SPL6_9BACT|nr:hypothetical protein HMPREF9441_01299 [Paraprevotella clara YIT 11840]
MKSIYIFCFLFFACLYSASFYSIMGTFFPFSIFQPRILYL